MLSFVIVSGGAPRACLKCICLEEQGGYGKPVYLEKGVVSPSLLIFDPTKDLPQTAFFPCSPFHNAHLIFPYSFVA